MSNPMGSPGEESSEEKFRRHEEIKKTVFTISATDGPCMACMSARNRIGAKPGDILRIEHDRSVIHRRVFKIPQMAVPMANKNMIWLNVSDMGLLEAENGSQALVTVSEETDEFP